ncbi:MAG: MerR family transcriptional regulator, partial [Desulfobacteraceae bacterium]|nr:MerR family transcriptional regulator [Desulfobacteraceae bacterium]
METKNLLRISRLAQKTGVTHRTIRFYVQERLITKPIRVRKNMALYHPDTVFQIQAIKKAQTQRFMPLVVIRKTLEENQYDYEALEAPMENDVPELGSMIKGVDSFEALPSHILSAMEKRKWIAANPEGEKKYPVSSTRLVCLFDILNQQGAQWEDLIDALDSIESLVKETMELEFRSFTGWAL